jgi:hypothetical protein
MHTVDCPPELQEVELLQGKAYLHAIERVALGLVEELRHLPAGGRGGTCVLNGRLDSVWHGWAPHSQAHRDVGRQHF